MAIFFRFLLAFAVLVGGLTVGREAARSQPERASLSADEAPESAGWLEPEGHPSSWGGEERPDPEPESDEMVMARVFATGSLPAGSIHDHEILIRARSPSGGVFRPPQT